jgi:hypothetical protein
MKQLFSRPSAHGGQRRPRIIWLVTLPLVMISQLFCEREIPMKAFVSSSLACWSKRDYRVPLVATLLALVLAFSALSFAPSAHTAISEGTTLTSVHAEMLTLPAASCSALQKAHPGASCQGVFSSTLTIHSVLSSGKLAAAIPATWYTWSTSASVCSILGCVVWGLHLQANGVLNYGISIWQYNVFCNAQGLASCTWHGYFGNGTSVIQVGVDGNACVTGYCGAHGIRQSINDKGATVSFYTW